MKILFASDMSFNDFLCYPGKEQAQKTMQETAKYFRSADFSILNLENIVGDEKEYTPIIKSGPNLISEDSFIDYVDVLHPTAVGLANNHAGDFGGEALMHTIKLLDEKGYSHTGAGKNIKEAYRPVVFKKDGISVAVIAVCENGFGIAEDDKAGSAGYRLGLVTEAIKSAKMDGNMPIIYFHGGNERNPFPSPGKVELYRHFVDIGAEAVIAMHTHCPQGYEMYHEKPIVYSMGNFFFPSETPHGGAESWNYGYMTELEISKNKIEMKVIPYSFDFECHRVFHGSEKESFLAYLEVLNGVIGDEKLLQKYFDGWCMIAGMTNYINDLKYSENMEHDGADSVRHLKNLLSCEAHNELMTHTLKILFDGRCADARELVPQIKKLQSMKI